MKNLKNMLGTLLFIILAAGLPIYPAPAVIAEDKTEKTEKKQNFAARAQRVITAPVDYIFGEESSYAKTAFYGVVGTAIVATGAYGVYRYFYEKALTQELEAHNTTIEALKKERENEELRWAKLAEARVNEIQKQKTEADLRLYKSIVADRINTRTELDAIPDKRKKHEQDWSDNKWRYSKRPDMFGNTDYHDAEVRHYQELVELDRRYIYLSKHYSDVKKQDRHFKQNHENISSEQFKEIEEWAQGVLGRWGRVIIA
jgi:hypothetical protein